MDSKENNIVAILINLFNTAHAFTILQIELILMMRTDYNNNENIESENGWRADQRSNCISSSVQKISIFDPFEALLGFQNTLK